MKPEPCAPKWKETAFFSHFNYEEERVAYPLKSAENGLKTGNKAKKTAKQTKKQ